MDETRKSGRVTIPTDLDVVPETLEILKKWGADAIRDCDGTDFPQQLKDADAKIYSTYYTTRKDNAWAKANPDQESESSWQMEVKKQKVLQIILPKTMITMELECFCKNI